MATTTMPKPKPKAQQPAAAAPATQTGNKKPRTISVLEFTAEPLRVDREKGVIHGVKLLGRESKNGHTYSDPALKQAMRQYEGAAVNVDHPEGRNATADRRVFDRFGEIRNVALRSDGVYGDHHYLKTHPIVEQVLELAERFPDKLGYSHNAVVTESVKDGHVIFESVERVRSVDLVANPATTRGVFESESEYTSMDDQAALATDPNAAAAAAPTDTDDKTTEESMAEALKLAVNAILDDPDLNVDQMKEKIATLIQAHADVSKDKPADDAAASGEGASKDETESLKQRLTKLEALDKARSVLESKGFRPTSTETKAFAALESDAEKNEFVETLKKAATPAAPASPAKPRNTAANALESQRQNGGGVNAAPFASPKTREELLAQTYELMRP